VRHVEGDEPARDQIILYLFSDTKKLNKREDIFFKEQCFFLLVYIFELSLDLRPNSWTISRQMS
jgi:hypothetical protein